jgi:hypothetical protein
MPFYERNKKTGEMVQVQKGIVGGHPASERLASIFMKPKPDSLGVKVTNRGMKKGEGFFSRAIAGIRSRLSPAKK